MHMRISGDVCYLYLSPTPALTRGLVFILIFTLSLTTIILTLLTITSVLVTIPMETVTIIILGPYYLASLAQVRFIMFICY